MTSHRLIRYAFAVFVIACISAVCVFLFVYAHMRLTRELAVEREAFLMGTYVQIKVPVRDDMTIKKAERAVKAALAEMADVERLFSVYRPESEISKINDLMPGHSRILPDEVYFLIRRSVMYAELTDGAFDITVKPLVDLWKDARAKSKIPIESEIKQALARVGSVHLLLDDINRTIAFQRDGMGLDMGAIAKGYATDRAIKVLRESGVKNAIVNSGGDMYCLGRKSERDLWKVAIRHPRSKEKVCLELRISDKAVVTSGDYEKYFMLDGKRYSHIIDPRTGWPIGDGVVSATVIADDAATADALATALCVLGEKGLGTVRLLGDVDALIIIYRDKKLIVRTTDAFKEKYGLVRK